MGINLYGQQKLLKIKSPILFKGDSFTAYRDPAVLFHDKTYYLFFTLVEIEEDGKVFSYTATSESRDLKKWSSPRKITPRDQTLDYCSPGNVIRFKNEWILCLQTYPRPGQFINQPVRYGDATARIFIMRSSDLVNWSSPELLKVKGNDVKVEDMGRMIDPYLIEDKDEKGKYWCFYKQRGVSMSYSQDLVNWTFFGFTESGENTCVLTENNEYTMFHSPSNGIGIKKSNDLKNWTSWGTLITLGQDHWSWARGRITAGAVINLKDVKGIGNYVMFFHGSGPLKENEGDFDRNASLGIAWSKDLVNWSWPGKNTGRNSPSTVVSIKEDKWYFNDRILNEGSPAEGLLMNVRMVNSVFEDIGDKMPAEFRGYDPEENTDEFISRIPEYASSGVNAFTISLQGGAPGYEGSINTAFGSNGSLRPEYMDRVGRVIKAADENNTAVILSCFYQRQHSHSLALDGREAIIKALENAVIWIKKNNYKNVILEVSNEYRHGGYRNWKDGRWIVSTKGQAELLKVAKNLHPALIVGTSGMGDGSLADSLVGVADYITIHFNNTSLENYEEKITSVRKVGKPVICNEDDKLRQAGASACLLSVLNGCGWGFMHSRRNQTIPFGFEGVKDDTAVYSMMKKLSSPGFKIDKVALREHSLIITTPNDGDIFGNGKRITVRFSFLTSDDPGKNIIKIFGNQKELGVVGENLKQFSFDPAETGIIYLEAVVYDQEGNEKLRSPRVDIIIK